MRSLACLLLLIYLSLSTFAVVSTNVDGVKMRSGPGAEYKQVMDLPKFYPLKVIAKAGEWYKVVDWMNTRGWIQSSLVSNEKTVVVRKIRVNLRSGPGTRYQKVSQLYKGYILRVLQSYGSWYKVVVVDPPENKEGWVQIRLVWG